MTTGFGIEKLGLISLRYPKSSLLLVAIVTPLLAFAAAKLEFTSDIREMFRSASPDFTELDEVSAQFPASEHDIQLAVRGGDLLAEEHVEVLRELHDALGRLDGVGSVLSMFSAEALPGPLGESRGSFFDANSELGREELADRAARHPLIGNKLLSSDAQMALFLIELRQEDRSLAQSRAVTSAVRTTAERVLAGHGLSAGATGLAVLRVEIIGALKRDQQTFRFAAVGIGAAVAWIFFRRLLYVFVAGTPAVLAIVWLLGGMQLAGQDMNVLTNVAPTIVLVIAFSDAVHMLFEIRRRLGEGHSIEKATEDAVLRIGPACVLTSLTTLLALSSLIFVSHPFIARFGMTAAAGAVLALVSILVVLPAMSVLLLGRSAAWDENDRVLRSLQWVSAALARLGSSYAYAISIAGIALAAAAAWAHWQNEPQYRHTDNLPHDNAAYRTIEAIETELGGSNTLRVLIDWPAEYDMTSPSTLEAIRDAHEIVASEKMFSGVSSLSDVSAWLPKGANTGLALAGFLRANETSALARRLISSTHTSALVLAQFPDVPANELLPVLDRLEHRLEELETPYPGATFSVTGLAALSARASFEMINDLNRSLVIAIGVIIVLIGLALRSVRSALVSILPNALPLLVGGAYLYLTEQGLQFTSVVAFTIGFGLAVDSTIHMLNRYDLTEQSGRPGGDRLVETVRSVGPVVIVSSLVVAGGLGSTLLSEMPVVQLYGAVVVVVLLTALVADLLLLPALMASFERLRGRNSTAGDPEQT